MDYEKAYKEALGLAKSYYGKGCNEFLDTIFPELVESEDERIRKALIDGVRQIRCKNGITQEQMIAYLEKQKEQKPDTRTADDLQLLGFIYDLLASLDWREDYAMSRDECLRRLNDYRPQKPAEWSDTDNIGWDEAFACVTRAEKAAKNEEELQNAVTAEKWLKEIKFKYGEAASWKPSEEQMAALVSVTKNLFAEMPERHRLESLHSDLKKL